MSNDLPTPLSVEDIRNLSGLERAFRKIAHYFRIRNNFVFWRGGPKWMQQQRERLQQHHRELYERRYALSKELRSRGADVKGTATATFDRWYDASTKMYYGPRQENLQAIVDLYNDLFTKEQ